MSELGGKGGRTASTSESSNLMKVTREHSGVGGRWNEEFVNSEEDGAETLTSAWRAKFLHGPLAFS